ncbi:MAG: sulfotransferase [Gammaproteobacteria bacterium]
MMFSYDNDAVRRGVPPERLLEWRAGDGWEPLCRALGLPVPDEPFPHANTTDEFLDAMAKR